MKTQQGPTCERYEILASTSMDEALDRDEQQELLDHVVRCESCREFFVDARALEGLSVMTGARAATEEPSPEIWAQIESRAADGDQRRTGGMPAWAWRAAAALLLGAALAFVPWPAAPTNDLNARQMDVVLEGDRGDMTEGRFLQLTGEILRADRRFHFAMQEVMEKVIDHEWDSEGSTSEGLTEDNTSDEDEGEHSPYRA